MEAAIDRIMQTYDLLLNRTTAASEEARAKVTEYVTTLFEAGEKDTHRLTVCGLAGADETRRNHSEQTLNLLKSTLENPHWATKWRSTASTGTSSWRRPRACRRVAATADLIAVGKTCTVFGYPHTSKPDEARIEYIVLDGKRIELR